MPYNLCNILHLPTMYTYYSVHFIINLWYLLSFVLINLHLNIFFLFWGGNANDEYFFILIFIYLLLVYRNTVNFCMLIFHPLILLNWIFPVDYCRFFGIFYINNHGNSFFLPNLHAFYFLFLFIALSRTSILCWITVVRTYVIALFRS